MLYLDIMTQDGGQVYLDIFNVELLKKRQSTGFSIQGVLGDGYRETQVLVEYIDAEASLTFLDRVWGVSPDSGCESEDLPEALRLALQDELGDAGVWMEARNSHDGPSMTCRLLAGDRWHGRESLPFYEPVFENPVVRERSCPSKFNGTDRVGRCFLPEPAVKKVQTRKRSLHAPTCSRLNKPLSTSTHAAAGTLLPGGGASVQGNA